jgi:hypothetical protein
MTEFHALLAQVRVDPPTLEWSDPRGELIAWA